MARLTDPLKKPWVVMPLVAILALGAWWAFVRDDSSASPQAAAATEQVVEVTVGDLAKTVTAEGTLEAAETEDLSFSSAGTVTAVNVAAGDVVSAGDVLAEIDSAELEAAVADAEAAVADAEATLADDEDAGASDEQLEADQSALTSAQDQLAAAQEALEGAQLVATIDGTVATVDLTVGEELSSGGAGATTSTGSGSGSGGSASTLGSDSGSAATVPGSTGGGTTTGTDGSSADISISSAGRYTVTLGFDDTDISSLAVGQIAEVSLSTSSSSSTDSLFPGGGGFPGGFPGATATTDESSDDEASDAEAATATTTTGDAVEGLVTEVGTIADASSGTASYPVTVSFRDDSGDFNAGATVSVTITYDEVADAIQVPTRAITTTDGASTVEVQTDDGTETRTVETGLVDGTMTQITSGLSAGESVVIDAPSFGGSGADGGFTPPEGMELPTRDAGTSTDEEGGS